MTCSASNVARCYFVAALAVAALLTANAAGAQSRPRPVQEERFSFRGFVDFGAETFSASESFKAVLGSSSGPIVGGGVELVLPHRFFANVRATRFSKSGQRVFVDNGETFNLGIDTTVTITPLEINGGYRFAPTAAFIVPYVGGGVGWHRYKETSEFATDEENVDDRFVGYQVLGGAEFRIMKWIAAAGEAQWTTVPNALGQNPSAVSTAFDETNLGGGTFRVKVVIGR
jgi:opacity protein-like surface antigen